MSTGPEDGSPPGELVDLCDDGTLIRLDDAGTLPARADRVLLSIDLDDGVLHLLGHARRNLRGDDGRWYVAVEFDEVEPMDRTRLDRLIASAAATGLEPDAGDVPGPSGTPARAARDESADAPATPQRSFSKITPSAARASIFVTS